MKVDISPYYMNFIENLPTHRVTRLVFFLFYIFLESFISPENWIEIFFFFWVNIEKKFPHLFKQTFLKKLMFFFLIFNSIFFSSQKKKIGGEGYLYGDLCFSRAGNIAGCHSPCVWSCEID